MNDRRADSDLAAALRHHGGAINAARALFATAPRPWIDLSTGINPHAYPVEPISAAAWTRLPERAEIAALEDAARAAYGVDPSADVVAAPGTQALIQWLPRLFPARRVGIVGPTYGEHETCWRAAGATLIEGLGLPDLPDCDTIVVVNPNNPDGRLVPSSALAETASSLAARGGLLVVDEAFMDVMAPGVSLAPDLPPGALVLRSFGKTYGLAGLRLGFAIAAPSLAHKLKEALGPWAVAGPAIEIGKRALADRAWLRSTRRKLAEDSARMNAVLAAAGFSILGGAPLFTLVARADAAHWFDRLCRAGILTRPFSSRPDALRFGIPHPDAWERLEAALRAG